MKTNIALVGFMGAGKTVVAKEVAGRLGHKLVSTDALIVAKEGKPITDIFEKEGEKYFRDLEKQIVGEISEKENLVIDCGGGIVLQDENVANLKKSGVIIYLKTSTDKIHDRTKNHKHRPLLNVEDPKGKINELLSFREPFYAKADITIDTSEKTIAQVVDEALKAVPNNKS
ncbi:MAG: shikimate kinase [Candidatus Aceula meridiana]|nr:shikimate kinase [Candidatus Aceula meridiana]